MSTVNEIKKQFLGYEYYPSLGNLFQVRGTTIYHTIKFKLVLIFNFPFRFHTCGICNKKWICHNINFRHGKGTHDFCLDCWLTPEADRRRGIYR